MEVHAGLQSRATEAGGPAACASRPAKEGNLETSNHSYEGPPSAGDARQSLRTARRGGQQRDEQPE
eukprot:4595811-Heterocapsa_arctica.AAC.1